jgi:hypothetical protein
LLPEVKVRPCLVEPLLLPATPLPLPFAGELSPPLRPLPLLPAEASSLAFSIANAASVEAGAGACCTSGSVTSAHVPLLGPVPVTVPALVTILVSVLVSALVSVSFDGAPHLLIPFFCPAFSLLPSAVLMLLVAVVVAVVVAMVVAVVLVVAVAVAVMVVLAVAIVLALVLVSALALALTAKEELYFGMGGTGMRDGGMGAGGTKGGGGGGTVPKRPALLVDTGGEGAGTALPAGRGLSDNWDVDLVNDGGCGGATSAPLGEVFPSARVEGGTVSGIASGTIREGD